MNLSGSCSAAACWQRTRQRSPVSPFITVTTLKMYLDTAGWRVFFNYQPDIHSKVFRVPRFFENNVHNEWTLRIHSWPSRAHHLRPTRKIRDHSHPESVAMFLTDTKPKFTYPDGKTEDFGAKAGTGCTWTRLPTCPKMSANSDSRVIQVELKG
jgi:hypothetical protein